jgi:hypothetical protein
MSKTKSPSLYVTVSLIYNNATLKIYAKLQPQKKSAISHAQNTTAL